MASEHHDFGDHYNVKRGGIIIGYNQLASKEFCVGVIGQFLSRLRIYFRND